MNSVKDNYFALAGAIAILCSFACTSNVHPTINPDWAEITLKAIGSGAPPANAINVAQARLMARQAAETDAYRKLAQEVEGIRISSETFVKDFITKSDTIATSVQSFIKGARIISTKENSDGSVEVTMELYLGKKFSEIIMR